MFFKEPPHVLFVGTGKTGRTTEVSCFVVIQRSESKKTEENQKQKVSVTFTLLSTLPSLHRYVP